MLEFKAQLKLKRMDDFHWKLWKKVLRNDSNGLSPSLELVFVLEANENKCKYAKRVLKRILLIGLFEIEATCIDEDLSGGSPPDNRKDM